MLDTFKSKYHKALQNNDAEGLKNLLKTEVPEYLSEKDKIEICLLKAEGFSFLGEWVAMDEAFFSAYQLLPVGEKFGLRLNWALSHLLRLKRGGDDIAYRYAFKRISEIVFCTKEEVEASESPLYASLTIANIRAFSYIYLGKTEVARKIFSEMIFEPVPVPVYNENDKLTFLFSNYIKGLAVAIELKDRNLLYQLMKVISVDDQVLIQEKNLFKVFHATLINTMDMRPEFAQEFNSFFQLDSLLKVRFPKFSEFLQLIRISDFQDLNRFFSEFK